MSEEKRGHPYYELWLEALVVKSDHPDPRCNLHDDDDPISCGWKRAYIDMLNALGL